MKKKTLFLIFFSLNLSLLGVGTEEIILTDILATTTEQIKKFNDQIKLATETLDQIDAMNKTLDNVDRLVFETGEKIFNPAQSLQKIISKIKRLEERMKNYPDKFQNGFNYNRFFKDYHAITCRTKYTKEENQTFQHLERETGIRIEELKIRKCMEENLTKKLTEKQKKALQDAYEKIKNGDYKGGLEQIKTFENERLAKEESINAQIVASQSAINDAYLDYFTIRDDGKTDMKRMNEELDSFLQEIRKNNKPDILTSISNTNAILIQIYKLTLKLYQAQIKFFSAYHKLQTALYAKTLLNRDEVEKIKKGEKEERIPYLEELKKLPEPKLDEFGLPKIVY